MRKVICLFVMVGLLLWQVPVFAAYRVTPRQAIYYHARTGNLYALQQIKAMGYHIDLADNSGNSALCEAVLKQNQQAVNILLSMGADSQSKCMQKIPESYKKRMGIDKDGQLLVDDGGVIASISAPPVAETALAAVVIAGGVVGLSALSGNGNGGTPNIPNGNSGDTDSCGTKVSHCKEQNCDGKSGSTWVCTLCEAGYTLQDNTCVSNGTGTGDESCQDVPPIPHCVKGMCFDKEWFCNACGDGYTADDNGQCALISDTKCSGQSIPYCTVQACDSDGKLNCMGCEDGYTTKLEGSNIICVLEEEYSMCQHGGIWNTDTEQCDCVNGYSGGACEIAPSTIDHCSVQNGTQCTTCETNYHLSTDTTTCYPNNIENCISYTNTTCTTCSGSLIPNEGGTACISATSTIDHCSIPNGTTCEACENGYHLSTDYTQCYPDNIENCIDYTNATCIDCSGDLVPSADGSACVEDSSPTPILHCSEQNGTTCEACENGYHLSTDYTQCYLDNIENCIDYTNATCIDCSGDLVPNADGSACVEEGGGSSGGSSSGTWSLTKGVKVLGEAKDVSTDGIYTNTENLIVDSYEGLSLYDGIADGNVTNYTENTYENLWIDNHIWKPLCDKYPLFCSEATSSKYYTPILYAGDPGSSGGTITLQNAAIVKHKYPENYNMVYDVFAWGANFENLSSGIIGEENGTEYASAYMGVYSAGAPIHVTNAGKIYGKIDVWGLNGEVTFNNTSTGYIASASIQGNVVGTNEGEIGSIALDGNAQLENSGQITKGVTLYRGSLNNTSTGTISGCTDCTSSAIMVLGPSVVTNSGTINGNIDVEKYYNIDLSVYPWGEYESFETRASLTFNNTGIFNGKIRYNTPEQDEEGHEIWTDVSETSGTYSATIQVNNAGQINSDSVLDFDTFAGSNGKVSLLDGGSFTAPAVRGKLYVNGNTDGFAKEYTLTDSINAGNTDGLMLKSQSALFDAKLAENGRDVVMTMKGFEKVTDNATLAQFLATNYALNNNETFYNKLKSFGSVNTLTDSLNKLTGKDMLSRFNFEDMTMMRELNYDMNEKLFHNKERTFAVAGSVSPMAFKGDTGSNAKYSLYNKRNGNTSIGLGVAFTDVRSDDDHDKDNRRETSYQLILPIGYKTHGFNLMASPRIGYARGTYDRTGFDGSNYDGTIEKRVFGLMNEARYPITVGNWRFEPAAEFNILGYQQKGREDAKEFALKIQNQNTYSVEGGIGLYATREDNFGDNGTLKLMTGVVAYHEFADPYKLRVGMDGMNGDFTLRDEKRSDNRVVVRAGFNYDKDDLSLYGSLMSYIDREWRTNAKTGINWKF